MKKQTFSTHIFNFRLFLEGLKRLRVTITALGIITIAFSALVPIIAFLERSPGPRHDILGNLIITEIKYQTVCVPASLAVLLSPIFFSVLFSFLQKRKQSDFFHAIPYTRTCVYISFVTAAIVSICAIQLVAGAVGGILWGMVPYTTYDVGSYIGIVLTNLLGSVMLGAFMMLALCVTGTSGSSYILFLLFASLPRIVMGVFTAFIRNNPVMDIDYWLEESFLSPLWFYPLASIGSYLSQTTTIEHFLFNPATILYSIAASLLIFTVGGFLYGRRQSEMAGNPAPGKKTQALFRTLFALPLALLITTLIALDSSSADSSLILVLGVMTVLCYFLYELVTTKRAANMGKAIPGFFLLIGICVVFGMISFFAPKAYLQMESLTPQNVESITVPKRMLTSNSYGSSKDMVEVDNSEILSILSNAYSRTKQNDQHQNGLSYMVTIEKKAGMKLHRRINITTEERERISSLYLSDLANLTDAIPNPSTVDTVRIEVKFGLDVFKNITSLRNVPAAETTTLLILLQEEYNTLPVESRKVVIGTTPYDSGTGEINNQGFFITLYAGDEITNCYVNEYLPKTRRYLLSLFTDVSESQLNIKKSPSDTEKTVAAMLERTTKMLHDHDQARYIDVNLQIHAQPFTGTNFNYIGGSVAIDGENLETVLKFLRERLVKVTSEGDMQLIGDIPATGADYTIWYLHMEYRFDYYSDYPVDAQINMAVMMNKKDVEMFRDLLGL